MMKDFQNIKKISLLFLFIILINLKINASNCKKTNTKKIFLGEFCDLCGCSTSSGSFGFGTLTNTNFIGFRYIFQTFESKNGIFKNSLKSRETFNTYQLWAQLPITNSFFLSANLPYQNLVRDYDDVKENLNGFGDVSVVGWYKIKFYKNKAPLDLEENRAFTGHSLQLGLGVKLPTGKFEERLTDNINPGFQVGTGSLDAIFSLGYNFIGDKIGLNSTVSYYLKNENKNDYQFGNQFSYTVNLYKPFKVKTVNVMPSIGLSGDVYDVIKQYGETLKDTDGSILNLNIGSELTVKQFVFGVNYTFPIKQKLFGGNVTSNQRLSIYINCAI